MASRYVYSIHSHTKWGVDLGVRFFSVWCMNDQDALALLATVNAHLPNYSKLSCSKVIQETLDFEIPDEGANLTDVAVVSWLFSSTQDPDVRRTVKIPLPYVVSGDTATVDGKSIVQQALMENCVSPTGAPLDVLISTSEAGKNIVQGPPVNAPVTP